MMGFWVWMICNYKIEQLYDGGGMGKRRHCGWELQCLSVHFCMRVAMEKHEARRQNIRDNPRSLFGAAGKGVESIPFLAIFPCKAKNPEPVLWGQTQATTLEETPFPLPQREHKYTQSMGSIIMGVFLKVSLGIDCPDYALLFLVFRMFQMIFFSSSFFSVVGWVGQGLS